MVLLIVLIRLFLMLFDLFSFILCVSCLLSYCNLIFGRLFVWLVGLIVLFIIYLFKLK